MNDIVQPESGIAILSNIADNIEQCGQQNIVQSCFHQHCNKLFFFSCKFLVDCGPEIKNIFSVEDQFKYSDLYQELCVFPA